MTRRERRLRWSRSRSTSFSGGVHERAMPAQPHTHTHTQSCSCSTHFPLLAAAQQHVERLSAEPTASGRKRVDTHTLMSCPHDRGREFLYDCAHRSSNIPRSSAHCHTCTSSRFHCCAHLRCSTVLSLTFHRIPPPTIYCSYPFGSSTGPHHSTDTLTRPPYHTSAAISANRVSTYLATIARPSAMISSERYLGLFDRQYVSNFAFTPGRIPFSTYTSIATVILTYLCLVLSIKQYIRHRGKPYDLRSFSILYNASLSIMSLLFLVQHLREVTRLLSTHSFWSVFCDEKVEHTRGSHVFWYYVM